MKEEEEDDVLPDEDEPDEDEPEDEPEDAEEKPEKQSADGEGDELPAGELVEIVAQFADIGFGCGFIVKEQVRALKSRVEEVPMTHNSAPDIGGQTGQNQISETVMGIQRWHGFTSWWYSTLFYTSGEEIASV